MIEFNLFIIEYYTRLRAIRLTLYMYMSAFGARMSLLHAREAALAALRQDAEAELCASPALDVTMVELVPGPAPFSR